MTDITNSGVRDIAQRIREGKISAADTAAAFVAKAHKHSELNAFVRVFDTPAAAVGNGALLGVPIAHKDIFCERGVLSTCASRILENFVAPYDAAVVERARAAGMVSIGRTNMDEFAMGSSGENSVYAPTKNPWDIKRVPGGSSSGSAAAVAARLCAVATGTDTGGSIRLPASFCGVTGIKPTYGRVSRWGMTAFASGFDQGGVLAKSADDCALALSAIAGYDERDSTSLNEPAEDYCRLFDNFTPLTVGVPKQFFDDRLDNGVATRVHEALAQIEKLGAKIVDIDLPSVRYAIPAYYVLTSAEASSNLSRYDGVRYGYRAEDVDDLQELYKKTRAEGFGTEVKRRVMVGTYVLSYGYKDAYYRRAMRVRRLIADDFARAFEHCDIIAGPTAPGVAFLLGELSSGDPVQMYLQDIYTVPVNLAGLPALSAPCGFVDELPVGLQLIGSPLTEARLLAAADGYQKHTDWHLRTPPLT